MKKALAILSILALTVFLPVAYGMPVDQNGKAYPMAGPLGITAPLNRTYSSSSLVLNASVVCLPAGNVHMSFTYSLDGNSNQNLPYVTVASAGSMIQELATASTTLTGLSNGAHSVTVIVEYDVDATPPTVATDQSTVYFTVDTANPAASQDNTPPVVSNVSIQNTTYHASELPLTFTLNETVTWVGYNLDGRANGTFAGLYDPNQWGTQFNATISGLTIGSHRLTVYANDTYGNTGASGTVYFTVAPDFWTQLFPMQNSRTGLGVAALDGKVYAVGGYSSIQNTFLGTIEAYDPSTGLWTTAAPMPTPRSGFAMASCDGKIYVFGGQTSISVDGYTNATEAYDPATNTWAEKETIPMGQYDLSASAVNGKIFVFGGPNGTICECYDPETNTWAAKASPPQPVILAASAALDGKVYVMSGQNVAANASQGTTQIYDPTTDTWTMGAPSPVAVDAAAAAATTGVYAPKTIYLIGGSTEFFHPGSNHVQVYFPENNTWTTAAPLPTARAQLGVAVVDDQIYALGGTNSRTPQPNTDGQGGYLVYAGLSTNERYTPLGYGTINGVPPAPQGLPYMPQPSPTPTSSTQPTSPPTKTTPIPQPSSAAPTPSPTTAPTAPPHIQTESAPFVSPLDVLIVAVLFAAVSLSMVAVGMRYRRSRSKNKVEA